MSAIRNSVKAIIIRDDSLLATRNSFKGTEWYLLPGGGQLHGECLTDALRRECREEIGAEVQVGELRFVRDYIGANHEFADVDGAAHQVEFMFQCDVADDYSASSGTEPDVYQVGVCWLPLSELAELPLYPLELRTRLSANDGTPNIAYLGDIN